MGRGTKIDDDSAQGAVPSAQGSVSSAQCPVPSPQGAVAVLCDTFVAAAVGNRRTLFNLTARGVEDRANAIAVELTRRGVSYELTPAPLGGVCLTIFQTETR